VAGAVLFLVALLVSLGAALAAPLGMLFVRRWTARHNRRSSVVASLLGAVLATAVAAAALLLVIFTVVPEFRQEIQKPSQEAQAKPAKLPDWYTRMFPQAQRTDSATQQLVRSPAFTTLALIAGGAMASLFLGVLGGALGWGGSSLLAFAWRGRRGADAVPRNPIIPIP
jgi:predicted PurR-regulated permease PerM